MARGITESKCHMTSDNAQMQCKKQNFAEKKKKKMRRTTFTADDALQVTSCRDDMDVAKQVNRWDLDGFATVIEHIVH